jgi:predicted NBD/HSP70 family sugar kinase
MKTRIFALREGSVGAQIKSVDLKLAILTSFFNDGENTIANLSKQLKASIPTVTKLIEEMLEDGLVVSLGKLETSGGRKPLLYAINKSAGYFVGVDIQRKFISLIALDLTKEIVKYEEYDDFVLENSPESMKIVCNRVNKFVKSLKIKKEQLYGIGVNLSGRVNSISKESFSFFNFEDNSLHLALSKMFDCNIEVENDTRAMTYAEMKYGVATEKSNILFVNISRGVGLGIINEGEIYYGENGFAGEFGHIPVFDNSKICHCGKTGCLETELSGIALENSIVDILKNKDVATQLRVHYEKSGELSIEQIFEAVKKEDVFAIEQISEFGEKLGKSLSILINLFNPGLIVIGGRIAEVGEYISLPVRSAINKYALRLMSQNTDIKISKLGRDAGALGAASITSDNFFRPR